MEMDSIAIKNAPSVDTFRMVMSTYDKLGVTTNLLTEKLRKLGYQAQASHPLGGLVLYPPLAVQAGLGWIGRHGLLIPPQFGPRQRIKCLPVFVKQQGCIICVKECTFTQNNYENVYERFKIQNC